MSKANLPVAARRHSALDGALSVGGSIEKGHA
jgi:hypothetical protein